MRDEIVTETPEEARDRIANEKFGDLVLRLMDVPDVKDEKMKGGSHIPVRRFDDPRYARQELVMNMDSRMEPSVLRFTSLCQALASGFKAAYAPPIDRDLAKTKWLSACLELMAEPILKSPKNDWKTTLTIPDKYTIAEFFAKAIREMVGWMDAMCLSEPPSEPEDWGGLVAAIGRVFVDGRIKLRDGRLEVAIPGGMILRVNESGNLQIDDRPLYALMSACEQHGAADAYREGECPTECMAQLAIGNLALEYDHDAICHDCKAKIDLAYNDLANRFTRYLNAQDDATRRAALAFDPCANGWYSYYLGEYCTPVESHLAKADNEKVQVGLVRDWLDQMDTLSATVCDRVLLDAGRSDAANAMHNAWREIQAKFAMRSLTGAMPTYASQEAFAKELSGFMELFSEALATIDSSKRDASLQLDVASSSPQLGEWVRENVVHSVDFAKREVVFKGNKKGRPGKTLRCPDTSDAPWSYLERMLISPDKEGWVELTKREAESYRQQFLRSKKGRKGARREGDKALREFYRHIDPFKGAGKRGNAKIRLVRRAKTIQGKTTGKRNANAACA